MIAQNMNNPIRPIKGYVKRCVLSREQEDVYKIGSFVRSGSTPCLNFNQEIHQKEHCGNGIICATKTPLETIPSSQKETNNIGLKFQFNANFVNIPRYNFNTVRKDFDTGNAVFKRRNINKQIRKNYLDSNKRLTILNEPPLKETNIMPVNKSPIKDLEICEIFSNNGDQCGLNKKKPTRLNSNRELLTAIKGIHLIDNCNQMIKHNKIPDKLLISKKLKENGIIAPL